jgi:hypothetical protein
MSSDTTFTATGPGTAGYDTNGSNVQEGADLQGITLGVLAACGPNGTAGVRGVGGQGAGVGVLAEGGANGGVGVFAQGGANGGHAIVAQNFPNAPVAQLRAQIRMVPVSLGGQDPNGANIPGEPGDLLAVLGAPLTAGASLWFNETGGPKGWAVVLGGFVGA